MAKAYQVLIKGRPQYQRIEASSVSVTSLSATAHSVQFFNEQNAIVAEFNRESLDGWYEESVGRRSENS